MSGQAPEEASPAIAAQFRQTRRTGNIVRLSDTAYRRSAADFFCSDAGRGIAEDVCIMCAETIGVDEHGVSERGFTSCHSNSHYWCALKWMCRSNTCVVCRKRTHHLARLRAVPSDLSGGGGGGGGQHVQLFAEYMVPRCDIAKVESADEDEDEEDDVSPEERSAPCEECGGSEGGDEVFLLCDKRCGTAAHHKCLGLSHIPEDPCGFFCRKCRRAVLGAPGLAAPESSSAPASSPLPPASASSSSPVLASSKPRPTAERDDTAVRAAAAAAAAALAASADLKTEREKYDLLSKRYDKLERTMQVALKEEGDKLYRLRALYSCLQAKVSIAERNLASGSSLARAEAQADAALARFQGDIAAAAAAQVKVLEESLRKRLLEASSSYRRICQLEEENARLRGRSALGGYRVGSTIISTPTSSSSSSTLLQPRALSAGNEVESPTAEDVGAASSLWAEDKGVVGFDRFLAEDGGSACSDKEAKEGEERIAEEGMEEGEVGEGETESKEEDDEKEMVAPTTAVDRVRAVRISQARCHELGPGPDDVFVIVEGGSIDIAVVVINSRDEIERTLVARVDDETTIQTVRASFEGFGARRCYVSVNNFRFGMRIRQSRWQMTSRAALIKVAEAQDTDTIAALRAITIYFCDRGAESECEGGSGGGGGSEGCEGGGVGGSSSAGGEAQREDFDTHFDVPGASSSSSSSSSSSAQQGWGRAQRQASVAANTTISSLLRPVERRGVPPAASRAAECRAAPAKSSKGRKRARVAVEDECCEQTTALVAASERGDVAEVESLVAAGAELNAANSAGKTALVAACTAGHVDVARALVAGGADVNAAGSRQHAQTALEVTRKRGNAELEAFLLEQGAGVEGIMYL